MRASDFWKLPFANTTRMIADFMVWLQGSVGGGPQTLEVGIVGNVGFPKPHLRLRPYAADILFNV